MPNVRNLSRSFAAGEITPELFGRVDLDQFQTGLATCRNFITLPHGPAANRPGFAFVLATKNSATRSRLIPFSYSTTQTMVLEFGSNYIRFHTQGETLLTTDGTAYYEVATPYGEADLFDLHYVQSADVLTITHPSYPPKELRRLGASNWTLTDISFVSSMAAPGTPTATATHGSTGTPVYIDYFYCVTALAANTLEESLASPVASCNNDLTLSGYTNAVTWPAVAGAARYNVYRKYQGIFAFIGQTEDLSITDNNIEPDTGTTPPELANPFSGAGSYPAAVGYHQQRRVFASTTNLPQTVWMTRTGTESNLSMSTPSRDTDALNYRIAAREANTIRHVVPLSELVLLTSSAEWAVTANGSATQAITPSTLSVQPQGYTGASNVVPVTVSNSLLYAMAMGGHVGEMTYNYYAGGYVTQDISVMAPHLFDFKTIADMAYSKSPYPIVWCVSSDGTLLGLTYSPSHKVSAWHHHDTDGTFESVCVVTEGDESVLYAIVRRNINGALLRYVERMHSRQVDVLSDSFFVDCGVLVTGSNITSVSGLGHIEGKTVSILVDGAVQPQQTVTNGTVTLAHAGSVVAVGLPITGDLQTLPFSFATEAYGQGRAKNVNKIWMRVHNSSGVFAGPSFDKLTQFKQRKTEPYGTPPAMVTGEIEITLSPSWQQDGSVCVRQTDPLPLIVASMTIEASIGG
ncbi:gp12 [Caballeronia arvi]|uniref:Gp12 n=1 Tax=Caballeronia arvi TaxID=1777135 RepID=A0A158HSW0_9BURK|nr:hypothetical protein [Caballeronia arvi]SAL47472.1 gp12 [Caballeronia arvi]